MAKPLPTHVREAFGKTPKEDRVPEGVCADCSGYSEYAGEMLTSLFIELHGFGSAPQT